MQSNELARILLALSRGLDPTSGVRIRAKTALKVLEEDEISKALETAALTLYPAVLDEDVAANRKSSSEGKRGNAGAKWSEGDKTRLLDEYTRGVPIQVLAESFGRTPLAIALRLEDKLSQEDHLQYLSRLRPKAPSYIYIQNGGGDPHTVTVTPAVSVIDTLLEDFNTADVFKDVDAGLILKCDSVLVYEERPEEKCNSKPYVACFDGGAEVSLMLEDFNALSDKLYSNDRARTHGLRFIKHENYLLHAGKLISISNSG